jgi:hypothetical protein
VGLLDAILVHDDLAVGQIVHFVVQSFSKQFGEFD